MKTRSQTKELYEVNIDFDDASNSWKQNKKYMGNGTYKYICPSLKKTIPFVVNLVIKIVIYAGIIVK